MDRTQIYSRAEVQHSARLKQVAFFEIVRQPFEPVFPVVQLCRHLRPNYSHAIAGEELKVTSDLPSPGLSNLVGTLAGSELHIG